MDGADPEPKLTEPDVMATSSMVTPNPFNPNNVPPIPISPSTDKSSSLSLSENSFSWFFTKSSVMISSGERTTNL